MDTGLSGRVDRSRLEAHHSEIGTDIDDLAATLGNHDARRLLARKENAFQSGGHGAVVLFLGYVESQGRAGPAGIVDEDVDAAESFDGLLHQRTQVGDSGYVR